MNFHSEACSLSAEETGQLSEEVTGRQTHSTAMLCAWGQAEQSGGPGEPAPSLGSWSIRGLLSHIPTFPKETPVPVLTFDKENVGGAVLRNVHESKY